MPGDDLDDELVDAPTASEHDSADPAEVPVGDDQGSVGDADEAPMWERIDWIVCGLIVLASLFLVALHARSYTTLSPIDEVQHVDYVIRAGTFDVPRRGERIEFEAMADAACRSVDAPNYVGPECGLDEYDPSAFQERGFNTAASQLPPYYTVTGLVSRAITGTGLLESHVTAARLVGALWAAAAWSVVWYVMALFRIRRRNRAIVVGTLMVTPLVLFHSATVNADAVLLFTGALALLATIKYENGRLNGWWLPPIFAGLILVEATNAVVTAACAVYLLARTLRDPDVGAAQRVIPAVTLGAVVVTRLYFFDWIQNVLFPSIPRSERGGTAPMFEGRDPETFTWTWSQILEQLPANFTPIANTYLPPFLREQSTISLIQLSNWMLIGLLFAAAFVFVEQAATAWLSRVTMAVLLLSGPFYTFYYANFSTVFYPAPGRFGLPMLPLVAVVAASALRTRSTQAVAGSIALLSALNTLYLLVS